MTRQDFLLFLDNYRDDTFPRYLVNIYQLLSCESEMDAMSILYKFQMSEAAYSVMLNRFKKRFPSQMEEIKFLEELYPKYKKKYNLEKKKQQQESCVESYCKILIKILKSGYSIEEYCAVYGGYTIKEIKMMHKYIMNNYPLLWETFNDKCMNSSDLFYIYIRNIVDRMLLMEDFNIFDYYYYTKLSIYDFVELSKNVTTLEELRVVNTVINQIKNQSKFNFGKTSVRIDLNSVTIISGVEVTKEEKEKIVDYLESNNIPLVAYKPALRKYAAGDERLTEYVNQNQKVMK